ncbi:hypothetical protein AAEP93_003264 [Penicillium crustosum]
MAGSFNIENFDINRSEIDFHDSVPKLKGQSNFRDWETALFLALTANNRYYTRILTYGIPILSPPQYHDTTVKGVTEDLLKDAQAVTSEADIVIIPSQIRTRTIELQEINSRLEKKYDSQYNN